MTLFLCIIYVFMIVTLIATSVPTGDIPVLTPIWYKIREAVGRIIYWLVRLVGGSGEQ